MLSSLMRKWNENEINNKLKNIGKNTTHTRKKSK